MKSLVAVLILFFSSQLFANNKNLLEAIQKANQASGVNVQCRTEGCEAGISQVSCQIRKPEPDGSQEGLCQLTNSEGLVSPVKGDTAIALFNALQASGFRAEIVKGSSYIDVQKVSCESRPLPSNVESTLTHSYHCSAEVNLPIYTGDY